MAIDVPVLAKQLVGAHQIVAMVAEAPLIVITYDEGETLAEPIAAIAEYYGLTAAGPWLLWVNLVTAMATVYGPRMYRAVYGPSSPAQATESSQAQYANVFDMKMPPYEPAMPQR